MREINVGGQTLLEYDNDDIYNNARNIQLCCVLSFIIALTTAVIYIVANTIRNSWNLRIELYVFFFIYLILTPLSLALQYGKAGKKPSEYTIPELNGIRRMVKLSEKMNIRNKDTARFPYASTILQFLMFEIIKVGMLPFVGLFDVEHFAAYMGVWAYHLGWMIPSSIFIYIGFIFLIKNCNLMKKEWDANPPSAVQEAIKKQQDEQQKSIEKQNYMKYKELIEKCGIRFFIKYYKQIKRLPLRDVNITENYSPTEKEERLNAAKQIIVLDLTELTLNEILKYSDILDSDEIKQAETLLAEITANTQSFDSISSSDDIDNTETNQTATLLTAITTKSRPINDDWDN